MSDLEAMNLLTYAGDADVDKGWQRSNEIGIRGAGTSSDAKAYDDAKAFIATQAKGTFVDDRGQTQSLFTAKASDFQNPAVYDQYRNNKDYRDYIWNVQGLNLKPDNPTPQEQATYDARQAHVNTATLKELLIVGAIAGAPAGIKYVAGKVAPKVTADVNPAAPSPNPLSDAEKTDLNARADDGQQYDHFRNPEPTAVPGGAWDWTKQAPNLGAVPGTTKSVTLQPGDNLDRFGSRYGEYLSPTGTPFEQRSLPPGKQSDPYEGYKVLRPFNVVQDEIAPAFGQPGGGTQLRAQIPEITNRFATVNDLIKFDYISDPKVKP